MSIKAEAPRLRKKWESEDLKRNEKNGVWPTTCGSDSPVQLSGSLASFDAGQTTCYPYN